MKLETNFLQFVYVEEVLNVYGGLSISMKDGYLYRREAHLLGCTFRRHVEFLN